METFEGLIRRLAAARIDFVIVGGYAAVFYGSARLTHDIDVCCRVIDIEGCRCRVLDLDALIDAKKAMAREKDSQVILDLEVLRERSKKKS